VSVAPSSRAQVGTVIEALRRVAIAARADSNAQRERMRQARVGGTYREQMALQLDRLVAYEKGVRFALLVAQEAEEAAG